MGILRHIWLNIFYIKIKSMPILWILIYSQKILCINTYVSIVYFHDFLLSKCMKTLIVS